jgi:NAD(P)-dependent dehydrogenase (short-subunit alcohol dehydrogenase family)
MQGEQRANAQRSRLTGRVAVVTGGGRGLGRAMALGLAQAGVYVVATAAREPAQLEAVAREAQQICGEARIIPHIANVIKEDDCSRVVETAIGDFGRLDILVNSAGRGMKYISDTFLTEPTKFWEVKPETWRMVIDTNVNGPFLMSRSVVPVMLRAGWGRIVNISMNYETMHRRGFSPYGPSKAALESETIIWSQDLAGTGVTVNALLPGGATLTGMIPDSFPKEKRSALIDPAIIVPPLLWLISEDSDGITGRRLVATKWRADLSGKEAAQAAIDSAGWQ